MTLVKSKKIEHQYELGNGSYAQIDPTGGLTVYNEDNIVVLSGRQTEVLKYALGFYDLPPEPKPICATCNDIHPDDGYYDHDFTAITEKPCTTCDGGKNVVEDYLHCPTCDGAGSVPITSETK